MKNKNSGFSLVELMVVIPIIGVLTTVVAINMGSHRMNSRVTTIMEDEGYVVDVTDSIFIVGVSRGLSTGMIDTAIANMIINEMKVADINKSVVNTDFDEAIGDTLDVVMLNDYIELIEFVYLIPKTDGVTMLNIIEEIKDETRRESYIIKDSTSEGSIIIEMKW